MATLLVIAVTIVLGVPAPASAGSISRIVKMQVKLYPAADSPFPHATGTVTLYRGSTPPLIGAVAVSVSRLAPNASYYMPVAYRYRDYWRVWHDQVYNVPVQTDARGNGGGWFGRTGGLGPNDFLIMSSLFQVYDSSGTLVLAGH